MKGLIIVSLALALLAGCVTYPRDPDEPASWRFSDPSWECRKIASQGMNLNNIPGCEPYNRYRQR
jgi:hypothetical protein